MVATEEIVVTSIEPIGRDEAERLSLRLTESMASLLEGLSQEQWDAQTDCELWRVRDMVAHLVGWSEALVSPREMGAQGIAALKRRGELGNIVDAQNQVQVDARRDLPTDELIARMRASGPRAARRRRSVSKALGWMPIYMGYMGGRISLSYLTDAIFPRDWLMHRIDISRALGRPLDVTAADQRLYDDIVRDWFGRTGAAARLHLTGDLGGAYVSAEPPVATLTADGVDFMRKLFGRASADVVRVEGDDAAAARWLATFFPV